jgi:hypothetical protein
MSVYCGRDFSRDDIQAIKRLMEQDRECPDFCV